MPTDGKIHIPIVRANQLRSLVTVQMDGPDRVELEANPQYFVRSQPCGSSKVRYAAHPKHPVKPTSSALVFCMMSFRKVIEVYENFAEPYGRIHSLRF